MILRVNSQVWHRREMGLTNYAGILLGTGPKRHKKHNGKSKKVKTVILKNVIITEKELVLAL